MQAARSSAEQPHVLYGLVDGAGFDKFRALG